MCAGLCFLFLFAERENRLRWTIIIITSALKGWICVLKNRHSKKSANAENSGSDIYAFHFSALAATKIDSIAFKALDTFEKAKKMRPWRSSWPQAQMALLVDFCCAKVTLSVPLACPPYTALDHEFLSSRSHQGPSGLNWWLILHMTVFQFHVDPPEWIFRKSEVMYICHELWHKSSPGTSWSSSLSLNGEMEEHGRRWKAIRATLLSETEKELKMPKCQLSCVLNNIYENIWSTVSAPLALSHMKICCTLQK